MASPIAACEGRFSGRTYLKTNPDNAGDVGTAWLHRTSAGCLVGPEFILRADGTAVIVKGGASGTWAGDEFYFRTDIGDRITEFTRTEAQPSK